MNKITSGKPGPGRPKGSPNKTTAAAKQVIQQASEELGGADRLVSWAKEDPLNERAFWSSIYPKLLPLQVAGDPDGEPIKVIGKITNEIIRAAPKP
jgi:hypothetical protein